MQEKRASKLVLVFATILLSTVGGCDLPRPLYDTRIAGQIIEADTGLPIVGAYVALLWRSLIVPTDFTGHNSRDICYHAAATTTDLQGRFEVPSWIKWKSYNVRNGEPVVLVYARSYVPLQATVQSATNWLGTEHVSQSYQLKRFSGTVDQRLNMLFWGLANRGCEYGGESQMSLYPMLRAVHAEAQEIARSKEDHQTVDVIARMAAKAGIAEDPTKPLDEMRLKGFLERNLQ